MGAIINDKSDALSKQDQAVVIADIDPHNMLEGKPRAQTMPSPLQLVAYLPLVESVDWSRTAENLLRTLSISKLAQNDKSMGKVKTRVQDEESFWRVVCEAQAKFDEQHLSALWSKFSDTDALFSRAKAYTFNGDMQPTAQHSASGLFSTPAHYDWIDVSLTLTEQDNLSSIAVPPWSGVKT